MASKSQGFSYPCSSEAKLLHECWEQIHDSKLCPFTLVFVWLRVWVGLVFETGSPLVQDDPDSLSRQRIALNLMSFRLYPHILEYQITGMHAPRTRFHATLGIESRALCVLDKRSSN